MILTEAQKKALAFFAASPLQKKFYWTGGTLLAFNYLKHRRSLDLDFFSEEKFSFAEINDWVQRFRKEAGFAKVSYQKVFDRYEFLFENEKKLRIEFVYYNRERESLKKRGKLLGVYIDSLEDIAANKVMAYFDRNEPKDLFDLYFLMIKKGFSPKRLLQLAQQKFGLELSEDLFFSESFKSLPLLREIKPLMIEKEERDKENLLKKVEDYFKGQSNQYLKRVLR